MINGILFIPNFIDNPNGLFEYLVENVVWDESMFSRKTASYGKAYNYSQISYPYQDFLPELNKINEVVQKVEQGVEQMERNGITS